MPKTFSAEELSRNPAQVFREADLNGEVKINHGQYKDKIFTLSARERKPLEVESDNAKI